MNENLRKYRWLQAERIKGLCLAQLRQLNEAESPLQSAVDGFRDLLKSNLDPLLYNAVIHDLGVTLFSLTFLYHYHGNILLAKTYAHESLALWREVKTNIIQIANSLNAVGYIDYQTGQYRAAWESFQEANEILKPIEAVSVHNHLFDSIGDLQRDLDEWDQAEETYKKSITIAKTSEVEARAYNAYLGLCILETWRGNFSQAMHNLREAARVQKIVEESPQYQYQSGAVYLEMGQFDLAIQALQNALSEWENLGVLHIEFALAAFWLGKAYFAKDQYEEARHFLNTCLELAARLGYDQFLVIQGRRSRPFLEYALQNWPETPQLLSLVSRIERFQGGLAQFQDPPIIIEPPKTHLEIYAFGTGSVRRDAQLIQKPAWRSAKSRALVFYLVERGSVRRADIKSDFWMELDTGKSTSNFQATLWRTRNALGHNEILINQGEQYTLGPHVTVWYDVEEFRNYLIRAADTNLSSFEQAGLWLQAIEIYKGDYLKDVFLDWTNSLRDELKNLYIQTLVNLATWNVKQRHYTEARNLYEKALSKEPYRDDIHLALMQSFVYSGAPNAAKAHFLDYQQFLHKEGLAPSQLLRDYYNYLLR